MMKNLFRKIIILMIFVFCISLPNLIFAQNDSLKEYIPLVENNKPVDHYTYELFMNTLTKKVVPFALAFAATVAVLFIAYAGWLYLTSGDSEGKRTTANKIMQNVVIGFLIASAAWLIIQAVANTLGLGTAYKPGGF